MEASLTVKEAAGLAKVSAKTIRRLCEAGTIRARNVGTAGRKVWRIDEWSYRRWLRGD